MWFSRYNLREKINLNKTKQWTSERGFILATAAAAVGLGNIWRFPYIVGENGGGSFVIAYIVSVILLGIPLMVLEISAGKTEHGSPIKTFRSINKRTSVFGWFVVALTIIIMSYYFAVTSWTLGFAVESYLGISQTFAEFTSNYMPLLYFFIVIGLAGFVVFKGLRAIEFLSKILMPFLFLIVIFLAIHSLTLESAGEALTFLFKPNLSSLSSISVWLLAFGQAFYSLAVGQGYLITYGSFLSDKINLPRAAGFVAFGETIVALLAGVIIFPIVFTFGLNPEQGTQLAFTTLPYVFELIPYGKYLAIMFFTLFFLAAISSCIAGMEVVKTAFKEEFKLSKKKATFYAFLPVLPLGFLSALSFTPVGFSFLGRPFLELLDLFAANQVVVASALIGGVIISWSISKNELVNSFGTKWKKMAKMIINIFRFLPLLAVIILVLALFI